MTTWGPLVIDHVAMILAPVESRGLRGALRIRELDCCPVASPRLTRATSGLARDRLDPAAPLDPHDGEIGSRGQPVGANRGQTRLLLRRRRSAAISKFGRKPDEPFAAEH